MLQLPKVLFLTASLFLMCISPSIAQTWTVESIDRENDDGSGRGFCVLRSSEGLVISVSGYENANYIGFEGRLAESIGLPWLPHGPILLTQTHVQVDDGYSATLDSTAHYVPKPESGGVLVDLYAYYPRIGQNLLGSMQQGTTLHIRVGEGFGVDNERNASITDPISFSLAGSNAAISEAIECSIKAPPPSFDGEAFGAAINAEIEAELAKLADQKCEFDEGIWKSGTLEDARIFYFDDQGSTMKRNVYFERWINNKVVARMYGNWMSSLGVPVYAVDILKEHHTYDEDPDGDFLTAEGRVAGLNVEFIYESDRDTPETMIFVGLNQALWNRGSEHVDFYGDIEDPDHVFAGPNHFEFFACRPGPATLSPLNRTGFAGGSNS